MTLIVEAQAIIPKEPMVNVDKLITESKQVLTEVVFGGKREMQIYPPQSPASEYRRTGTLRKSWSSVVQLQSGGIVGKVASNPNIAPYNEQVQGEAQDELFRAFGWKNVKTLAKEMNQQLEQKYPSVLEGST